MSPVHNAWRFTSRAAALLVIALFSATSSTGQFASQTTYVCQTPTFWCSFQYASGVPNGTSCYCNTVWGPVGGYSINPAGVPNAPTLPKPQTPSRPGNPTPTQGTPGEVEADDCYKGLGNCPGSFMRAASGGNSPSSTGKSSTSAGRSSTSAFGSALQELIDAAEDDFTDVRGAARRGNSVSDYYETTVVPAGLERCTLFVPKNQRRKPWVSCWASDGMSFSRLVRLVTDALGSDGSRDSDGQTWNLSNVQVTVERGSSLTLDIRLSRN
jgi:hypothetical protein